MFPEALKTQNGDFILHTTLKNTFQAYKHMPDLHCYRGENEK